MRRFGSTSLAVFAVALTWLVACSAGSDGAAGPAHRTGGAAGGGPATGSAGLGAFPATPSADDVKSRCQESSIAPPALRRLTRAELQTTLIDVFPELVSDWAGVKLGPDPLSALRFSNDASLLVVGPQAAGEILKTAKDVAASITGAAHLTKTLPCAASTPGQACAEQFIDTFGPKLYRRELSTEERQELMDYYSSVALRSDFTLGLKWTIVAMLQAPATLYRHELGDADGQLTQAELATQLAYTYSGSAPSDELRVKAGRGELASAEALLGEAQQLLATDRGQAALRQFFREWLAYERVLGSNKDGLPEFREIQQSQVAETRQFIDEVVQGGGGVKDLLTAKFTFVDAQLASFYGFGASSGPLTKVDRPAHYGAGILAQGSFLAGNAHPNQSSPTFRGLSVYARLLCSTPQKPPPNVPTIDMAEAANTTRERYEKAHTLGPCQTCHQQFDPLGFAFEHFDQAGRYREKDNGYDIDTSGSVTTPSGQSFTFEGFDDLVASLAADPAVTDCVSGLLATYAFGGGGGQVCLAEQPRTALALGQIGLRDYFAQLVKAPSFTQRRR